MIYITVLHKILQQVEIKRINCWESYMLLLVYFMSVRTINYNTKIHTFYEDKFISSYDVEYIFCYLCILFNKTYTVFYYYYANVYTIYRITCGRKIIEEYVSKMSQTLHELMFIIFFIPK
jgi:hypothetical protein